jgi:hypothetical protein
MKYFLFLLSLLAAGYANSQFNDSAQIQVIENTRSANEGDLYLDTVRKDFRIGLTHGKLGKLTDNQKLKLDTVTNVISLENGDSVNLNKVITGPRFYGGKFLITGAGSVSITGLPFRPTSLLFTAYANIETDSINSDNGVGDNTNTIVNSFNYMRGFARNDNSTITEQVICGGGNGTSINDISRYSSPNHSIGIRYANQNGNNIGITSGTITSFDATGFTINIDSFADGLLVIFEAHR